MPFLNAAPFLDPPPLWMSSSSIKPIYLGSYRDITYNNNNNNDDDDNNNDNSNNNNNININNDSNNKNNN